MDTNYKWWLNKIISLIQSSISASLWMCYHEIQALAQQNMKQYEWSHETSKESVLSKESLGVIATGCAASAPKAKAVAMTGAPTGTAPVTINYGVACKGFRTQMTKCIKELEKWSSKLRILDVLFFSRCRN